MTTLRRILSGVVLLIMVSGFARASSITLTETFTASQPSTQTEWSTNLDLSLFDPALGTLESVELSLAGSLTTTLTVTNDGASNSTGHAATKLAINVADPNLIPSDLAFQSPNFNFSNLSYVPGSNSIQSGLLSAGGSSDQIYTSVGILSEFTGAAGNPGNYDLAVSTTTQTNVAKSGGNDMATQITDASVTATVIYTYQEFQGDSQGPPGAPEPASLVLMGSALIGIGLLRKRLKS